MKLVRLLLLACICMMACRQQPQNNEVTNYDLPQMKDSGELVVLTLNSSTSYFNYRGEPMGFQYELAEQFARSLGVKLRMETAKNTHDLVHKLLTGEGDLIAYNLPITKEFKDSSRVLRRRHHYPPSTGATKQQQSPPSAECNRTDWQRSICETRQIS